MPDTVSGAGGIAMSKVVKNPCPRGTYLLVGRHTNEMVCQRVISAMEKVKYERETDVLRGCNLGGVLRSTSLRRWHLNEDLKAVRKYIDIWGKNIRGRGSS